VVGNVGLVGALAIVTLSASITFSITLLATLSVSAIAPDRVVRVGGAYDTISCSLGIETGGAVGISLYFAQMRADLRVSAQAQAIAAAGRPFDAIPHATSAAADLAFLGMAAPQGNYASYYESLQRRATALPTTLFVLAAPDFAFEAVLVEKGVLS